MGPSTLLTSLAHPRAPGAPSALAARAGDVADWTGLITDALAHGTAGTLCDHILALPEADTPADIRAAATAHVAFLRQALNDGLLQLRDLLAAFAEASIHAVPFKGPALAHLAFPDPALRRFTDLDILIDEPDIAAAMGVLEQRGYVSQNHGLRPRHMRAYWRYNGQDVLSAPNRLPIEPHWAFAQRTLAVRLDMRAMLDRARPLPMPLADGELIARGLCPEDALIAACLHGAKDEWTSLRAIVDVVAILDKFPALNWDSVLRHARQGGIQRILLLGLALATKQFSTPLPTPIPPLIAADPAIASLTTRVATNLAAPAATRSIFELSSFRWHMRERHADRLAYAARTICTPRTQHFRALDLPDRLGFLYPAVKLGHDYLALPLWRLTRGAKPR